jgi:hypothetical protein
VIDVPGVTLNSSCGRAGQSTITFRAAPATQTPTYRDGATSGLTRHSPAGPQPSPTAFNAATLNPSDPRPCILSPARRAATPSVKHSGTRTRRLARRGVSRAAAFRAVRRRGLHETIVFRVQAGDQAAIRNIARIIGQPYVQVTFVRFRGTQPGQVDEYVEVTNLGADEILPEGGRCAPA